MKTPALTGASLIGSSDVFGSGSVIHGFNPRTGEKLDPAYQLVGSAEVDCAAGLAEQAFASYRETSPLQRSAFLNSIADNILELGDALVERVVAETGIAKNRVEGEATRAMNQLRLFGSVVREGSWHAARIDTALPDRTPLPRPDIRLRKVPIGPVAVFGASNFPLAFSVAGGDTASALAAGSPVVVKAHGSHPGTSELVGRAIRAAVSEHGLHEGVFSLLFGEGSHVGTELVRDPRIAAVAFTGSRAAGLALTAAAASRPVPIPVYAEMSSINPVFLLPRALKANAVGLGDGWVSSVMTGVGQLCTSPGLVFVPENPDATEFIRSAEQTLVVAAAAPMLSSHIAEAFAQSAGVVSNHPGVRLLAHGVADNEIVAVGLPQLYVTDFDTFMSGEHLQAEMFGPASMVVTVRDPAQMLEALQSLEGQLTVTIHAEGAEPGARELTRAAELKAGRVVFNGWPTGVEVGYSMVHGGPFPATSNAATTSVGALSIERFLRPVSYQNAPAELLPAELQGDNPLGIWRMTDGRVGLG